ncbi:hypothetical protein Golob_020628 [Gossypium lobatum]|uniref:Uncharacterized protein n=1 Tax=Gossypium lobatum TaxID=34289 RepID=A0A7J8LB15_9ROSI|nr:hypothetical protein [Gossypium lobatum]
MDKNGGSSNGVRFKFNAYAPEFVSRLRTQMLPVSTYYYPFFHYLNGGDGSGGGGGFDWFFVGKQEPIVATYFIPNHNLFNPNFYPKNVLTDELRLKIIKQVKKLNDERNWRKGLRVRLLLRLSPKPILKTRKSEFDAILNEEDIKNSFQSNNVESTENKTEDIGVGSKKGGGKGRGKGRGRVQNHNRRGQLPTSPQPINPTTQCEASMKQTFKGPGIPDGTKGFTMGRGKPLNSYLE